MGGLLLVWVGTLLAAAVGVFYGLKMKVVEGLRKFERKEELLISLGIN